MPMTLTVTAGSAKIAAANGRTMGEVSFRTRAARRLVICIGFGLMLGLLGCSRPTPPPPQLAPNASAEPSDSQASLEAAKKAVLDYLRAIYAEDYKTAYDLLSTESRRRHSQEVFAKAAKEAWVLYDLEEAQVESRGENAAEVVVSLQQEEEPGTKAFSVVREKQQWRIVYYEGKPLFPYGG
jgi:hypothetical protein